MRVNSDDDDDSDVVTMLPHYHVVVSQTLGKVSTNRQGGGVRPCCHHCREQMWA